jgi:hypothetical protein
VSTHQRPAAPRPVAFLPSLLFQPERPAVYAVTAVGCSLAGALLLSTVANLIWPSLHGPEFPYSGVTFLTAVVLFAPLVETAILAAVLELLRRFLPPWTAVVICAAGWGIAHSSAAPAWGLVIWWPFIIFSLVYLTWRQRSFAAAYGMALVVHAAQNAVAAVPNAFA